MITGVLEVGYTRMEYKQGEGMKEVDYPNHLQLRFLRDGKVMLGTSDTSMHPDELANCLIEILELIRGDN